jgi:hypothetical protein
VTRHDHYSQPQLSGVRDEFAPTDFVSRHFAPVSISSAQLWSRAVRSATNGKLIYASAEISSKCSKRQW